ncbi:RHS repeat-associated core domain-containing protein [Flavobacterium sp. CBA20B-1]|uniref:RHS repeat-associated core domain-containing protein n=1 Tax=unclassified Flavobacterium TaxID=196869 RepID=UPI002224DFAB|nr:MULTISPECIES: RHS repeat-associated core domain-containing protein [unclassified Flavobacterium]WCM40984.1 RHS repeat-associated core domain-containing protein [Flavobacterium sp. CBA20B-1]
MSVRLSYADCDGNGTINPATEILEDNNYYPFGLKHKGYNEVVNSNRSESAEKYKYNGKELNEDLGVNVYEYGARFYMPDIGRWMVMDPVTHHDYSPYSAFDNNPVYWSDPSGADATTLINSLWDKSGNGLTSYTLEDGQIVDTYYDKNAADIVRTMLAFVLSPDETNGGGGDGNGDGGGNGNGGGGWQKLDKSTLRNYAQKLCNCSGGMLEQFTGALFENAWHSSYQLIGAIDNYRANKNKMKGGSRTTVPDGVSDGIIKRWFLSDIVVPNAAWFEVKAMNGTIYNSTSSSQIKGHITNLASFVPAAYRSWGYSKASAASLTLVTTTGVSIPTSVNALAASNNIILYQYTAQYMMNGSQMMIQFQLSSQNGVTIPFNYTTPPVPLK